MNGIALQNERTRELLIKHYKSYPKLTAQDIFKYIFQSAYGCEHLVKDEAIALDYINREYEKTAKTYSPLTEPLDGEYSRVHLSALNLGLKPETLARLFCLSAKKEEKGREKLEEKLRIAKELVINGELPLDVEEFNKSLEVWRSMEYPAIHHSEKFRREYSPAYRVVSKSFSDFLPLFCEIDKLSYKDSLIVTIEGGSASGKTTLAELLQRVYNCNVFHMDDYFLRAEDRTPERLAELGGNIDRERFSYEILQPIMKNEKVTYRRFDCASQTLGEPISVAENRLTVVEGAYSMHPAFGEYYDLSVFLNIEEDCQRKRILKRNSAQLANRFFSEWIPLENRYFSGTDAKKRARLIFTISD